MRGCNAQYHKTFGYSEAVETRFIKPPKVELRDYREVDEIMASIREKGLLQPIIIRPVGTKFEVVAGARRLQACRRLRWATIPCIIRKMSDKEAYEAALIENVQRKTMNPIEEAKAFDMYIKREGWGGETALASQIGKSQEYISHRLSLLHLPEAVKEVIIRRQLSASIGEEVARLPDKAMQIVLSSVAVEKHLTVTKVRKAIASMGAWNNSDSYSNELREQRTNGTLNTVIEATSAAKSQDPDFIRSVAKDDHRRLSEEEQVENAALILKLAMIRLSNLVDGIPHDSAVKEILAEERSNLHNMIDVLIKLGMKITKNSDIKMVPARPHATLDGSSHPLAALEYDPD